MGSCQTFNLQGLTLNLTFKSVFSHLKSIASLLPDVHLCTYISLLLQLLQTAQ